MDLLNVEEELLDEFRMLLEIPLTRQFLHHAKEVALTKFEEHIAQYKELKDPLNTDVGNNNHSGDTRESVQKAKRFDFHLQYRDGQWAPVIDLENSSFETGDLMPVGLIRYITGHAYARYHWYYIENRAFTTKNHGVLEFNGQFTYIHREFITGKVEIAGEDSDTLELEAPRQAQPECPEENIIYMNKNRKQFQEILNDRRACEFLHYFCTFPFYRDMILKNFRIMKPYLSVKFEKIINGLE
ncbi:MAG: hypothetical protein GTO45_20190 [Candidatus Aminicenantes bacterium]|nr:hypothetical protein [Candidatus Aminicenantes bacterium]NIM81116.1 hypothetical protein [Candidatus Aminicenantes bacterium]NIN20490.1 hypothetical protein [Candidatus Aminicenantes bacterium]NIN44263.1 hypothetical protein [Candidatus Aminicenantes bacterium]NIN87082.1 hypothetical protein [Candidatus Aminicenantes bacterium]